VNFTGRLGAGDHSARTGLPRVWNELRPLRSYSWGKAGVNRLITARIKGLLRERL
jgi:hypothetical protein